eukprot:1577021-Amphidinium_carterae.1
MVSCLFCSPEDLSSSLGSATVVKKAAPHAKVRSSLRNQANNRFAQSPKGQREGPLPTPALAHVQVFTVCGKHVPIPSSTDAFPFVDGVHSDKTRHGLQVLVLRMDVPSKKCLETCLPVYPLALDADICFCLNGLLCVAIVRKIINAEVHFASAARVVSSLGLCALQCRTQKTLVLDHADHGARHEPACQYNRCYTDLTQLPNPQNNKLKRRKASTPYQQQRQLLIVDVTEGAVCN